MNFKVKVINYEKDPFGIAEEQYSMYEKQKSDYYYNLLKEINKDLNGYTITATIDKVSGLTTFEIEPDLNDLSLRHRLLKLLVPLQIN